MSSSMMQRLPALDSSFCPTTLVTTFGDGTSSVERCGLFECAEVIDSK
jgi:hypothetical protein